jgi:SAM-dependent methyltransferase
VLKAMGRIQALPQLLSHFQGRSGPVELTEGPELIQLVGHRQYVGGLWDEIGRLQFDFLIARGLRPDHYFLDVACGSLRAGVHFIPYLEPGHYLGIDKEEGLIRAGIDQELSPAIYEEKRPVFVVDDKFSFGRFGVQPDFVMAQSLFTHLTGAHIRQCLRKLRNVIASAGEVYATFFEPEHAAQANPQQSNSTKRFSYTRVQMDAFGRASGFQSEYIDDWSHPRGQLMIRYRPMQQSAWKWRF